MLRLWTKINAFVSVVKGELHEIFKFKYNKMKIFHNDEKKINSNIIPSHSLKITIK